MLNKNLNVPLYAQLKELILGEIQSGALKAGDMIPTEHELMEQYSISRNVVRQAIGELVEGGYLIRKKAKGTFVSTPRPTWRRSVHWNPSASPHSAPVQFLRPRC